MIIKKNENCSNYYTLLFYPGNCNIATELILNLDGATEMV